MAKKRKAIPQKHKAILQQEISSKCPFCHNQDVAHFEIHHIDGDTSNNQITNLLMLCRICHSKIHDNEILIADVHKTKISLMICSPKNYISNQPNISDGKINNYIRGDSNSVSINNVKKIIKKNYQNPQDNKCTIESWQPVKYTVDKNSIKKYKSQSVKNRAIASLVSLIMFILLQIWILSISQPQIHHYSILFILISISILNLKYLVMLNTKKECRFTFLTHPKFLNNVEGEYMEYTKSGKCTYPGCNGKITINQAPKNTKNKISAIGYCTNASFSHIFSVENDNKVGYPIQLN